jgi:hypothetical protein
MNAIDRDRNSVDELAMVEPSLRLHRFAVKEWNNCQVTALHEGAGLRRTTRRCCPVPRPVRLPERWAEWPGARGSPAGRADTGVPPVAGIAHQACPLARIQVHRQLGRQRSCASARARPESPWP